VFSAQYGIKISVPYIFSLEFLDFLNIFPASLEHCPTEPDTEAQSFSNILFLNCTFYYQVACTCHQIFSLIGTLSIVSDVISLETSCLFHT